MRIGLNLLYLIPGQVGGTETYATKLMHSLNSLNQDDDYLVYVNKESAAFPVPESPRFTKIVCGVQASHRVKRYLFEQFVLPFLLQRHRVNILHSMGYVGPILPLKRHIITIHDANFVRLSWLMSPMRRWIYGLVTRLSAKTCNHIITISSFSKEELAQCLGVPRAKMTVVYHGAPALFAPKGALFTRSTATHPYVLVLGGGSRHKNIRAFVEAFARVHDQFPHNLLIAGRLNETFDASPEVIALIQTGRIRITGFLEDADLDAAYRGADLFVFPTLYEGFGLPLLEAQARGVPVLCSRVASLPELGGDSVAYFDPSSVEDMAANLSALLQNADARMDLVERGHRNAHRFNWELAAVQTHALYKSQLCPDLSVSPLQ